MQTEVIAMGEVLVDIIAAGVGPDIPCHRAPGGAPANVAAAFARLGVPAGFVGRVGTDENGDFALERLEQCGVDVSGVVRDPAHATTVARAVPDPASGELSYRFERGADLALGVGDLDAGLLRGMRIVHAGSMSLAGEPARTATLAALDTAREGGHLASVDVNARPLAWDSTDLMLREIDGLVGRADLLKVSRDELEMLCGGTGVDLIKGAGTLLARGPRLVAITCGAKGALLATHAAHAWTDAPAARHVADTAGAGDTFWAAVLAWLIREADARAPGDLDELGADELARCGRYACMAATLSVEHPGAMGSGPTAAELEKRIATNNQTVRWP